MFTEQSNEVKLTNEPTTMFKKKVPIGETSNGKTDENLLKMLGISLKKNSKDKPVSPKVF